MTEIVATLVFDDEKLRAYAQRSREEGYGPADPTPPPVEQIVTELLEGWTLEVEDTVDQGFAGVVSTRAELRRG